jgi:hypothetical protein
VVSHRTEEPYGQGIKGSSAFWLILSKEEKSMYKNYSLVRSVL